MIIPFSEFKHRSLVSDFAIKTITELKEMYSALPESELDSLAKKYNSTKSTPSAVAIAHYAKSLYA